jgi:hypothetical protein
VFSLKETLNDNRDNDNDDNDNGRNVCLFLNIVEKNSNNVKTIRKIFGACQYFSYPCNVKGKKKEDHGLRGVRARSYGHKSKGFGLKDKMQYKI